MNLPNKLTIGRMCAVVVVVILSCITKLAEVIVFSDVTLQELLLLIIFVLASITDCLDGKIARKYNLVTNFGKFMDPLADKLLVLSTMIALMSMGKFSAFGFDLSFCITIILSRELAVEGLRIVAADNKVVIAASKLGKYKTVSQMVCVIILLLNCFPFSLLGGYSKDIVTIIFVSICTILTLVSGIDYFVKNGHVLKEKNNN